MTPTPSLAVFASQLARLLAALQAEHAHGQVVIVLKDGQIQIVHVNRSFMPGDLPKPAV